MLPPPQAALKELIERASSHADRNLSRRKKPYPLGFAVRSNDSHFGFNLEMPTNEQAVAQLKTLFRQQNIVAYVLTLSAISEGNDG
jgi:hypothetical protein